MVDGYEEVAAAIDLDVDEIEAQVFGGDERDHAERIYKLKREVPSSGGRSCRWPSRCGASPAATCLDCRPHGAVLP